MLGKKRFWVAITAVAILVLLLSMRVYYVRTDSGGELFWNADNAYFFIAMADRGYRFSYLGYLVELVREIFPFGASAPSDKHFSVLVLQVTPSAVQRYSVDNFWLARVEPFQGTLYAANMLPGGGSMKWSGAQFEPTTPEEAERHHEYMIKLPTGPPAGPSYDNVEGWSKRTVAGDIVSESSTVFVEKDSKVTIEVGGHQLTFVMNSGYISHKAYVDLMQSGRPPERIWRLDGNAHQVSGADYRRIFESQDTDLQ